MFRSKSIYNVKMYLDIIDIQSYPSRLYDPLGSLR